MNRLLTADEMATGLLANIEHYAQELDEADRERFYEAVVAYLSPRKTTTIPTEAGLSCMSTNLYRQTP